MSLVDFESSFRFLRAYRPWLPLAAFRIIGAVAGRAQVTTATFYGSVVDSAGATGQGVRQAFTLAVGNLSETVTVEGSASQVNTVSAEQTQTFDSQKVTELPLARRNFSSILRVGAGVSGSAGSIRLDGIGRNGSGYSVDGTEAAADPAGRGSQNFGGGNYVDLFSIESIQEVNIVKGILAAEYSGAVGGQVNVLTRSGTNQLHGSLFENFQADDLNAGNPFLSNKPPYTHNQFGGSAGGPVRKDRIFVFGAYAGYRQSQAILLTGDVPTQATRDQVIRAQPTYAAPLSYVPLPNQPLASRTATTGRVVTTGVERRHDNHVELKGDLRITDSSTLVLTYSHGRPYRLSPAIQLNGAFDQDLQAYTDRATASYVRAGTSWTSETRFGYNVNDATRVGGSIKIAAPENSTEDSEFGRRLGSIATNLGWTTPGGEVVVLKGPTWSIGEKFAWHKSQHSFKFGGQYTHRCCTRLNTEGVVWTYAGLDDLLAKPTCTSSEFSHRTTGACAVTGIPEVIDSARVRDLTGKLVQRVSRVPEIRNAP